MIIHLSSRLAILALTSASTPDATRDTTLISIFLDVFTAILLLVGVVAFIWGKQIQKPNVGHKFGQISQKNNGHSKGASLANIVAILPIVWLLLILAGISLAPTPGLSNQPPPKPAPTSRPNPTTSSLLKPDTLIIGDAFNILPSTDQDQDNFENNLMTHIAENMKLQPQFTSENSVASLINALQQKHVDVAISTLQMTPALQQKVDFISYRNVGESLLVLQNGPNPTYFNSLTDLCNISIGVIDTSTAYKDLVKTCSNKGLLKYIKYQSTEDAVQQLRNQKIAAVFLDSTTTDYYVHHNPGTFARGSQVFNKVQEGIAIRKGNTALYQAIMKAYNELLKDETYSYLINYWGLNDSDQSSSSHNNQSSFSNGDQQ